MEGWLYLIRSNRIGLQYLTKRYFVLQDHYLKSYKSIPISDTEVPLRCAILDPCIRVTDNGRESIQRKVFFIFTLYSSSNHHDQLKLGARSSEEAARWIHSIQDAALMEFPSPGRNFVPCSKRKWRPLRFGRTKRTERATSIDWTVSPPTHRGNPMTSDVVAPSPWTIFGCQNGLRLFKEARDFQSSSWWDDHPAIMVVGVVDGTSEAVFHTLMSLGSSRSEWDFCFYRGSVVEHLDGHTDVVHEQLSNDWMPWGMGRRDLLLQRYWRRDDDGRYVILYHSVLHRECPPKNGYIRACLKSGGYVISPVNQGKQSIVKHMLAIDWKLWKSYLLASSSKSVTTHMLGRVAALREFFKAKVGNYAVDLSSRETTKDIGLPQSEKEEIKVEVLPVNEEVTENEEISKAKEEKEAAILSSGLVGLNDASDEFFDVPEPAEDEHLVSELSSQSSCELINEENCQPKLPSPATIVKKLHGLAEELCKTQKIGCTACKDTEVADNEMDTPCSFGATIPRSPDCTKECSYFSADPSAFLIRGENYLKDRHKVKANRTLMELVGADWLRSDKREDDLASRPGGIVQKYAAKCGSEFFFIINMQIPGNTRYNLVLYYMTETPLENTPLLDKFVKGDNAYRNSRFKLIPYISKGSWIVKQSVGKKACLVGQALETTYIRGKNYLELDVDVGSSTVARGVSGLVSGYLNSLVIEMAFLIQAETEDELPEILLGTCRFNHLDASKAFLVEE